MKNTIELDVGGSVVIPAQTLDGVIAKVAKIFKVFTSDADGRRTSVGFENAEAIRMQVQNRSDILNAESGIVLSPEDFLRVKKEYSVTNPSDLVGKSVLSVYSKGYGELLCGLIPLNMY